MHANCAFCHRPDGEFPQIDMRYEIPLANMGVCNVVPLKGNQGVLDAVELKPGEPAKSIVYLRMNSLVGAGRMPAIGTNQIDTAGVKLIGDWITSITSCPTP
jgi:mono/diheme cytochrome c family protein